MSFCQKHQNHHCVHAHHCKDPTHQPNIHPTKKTKPHQKPKKHQLFSIQEQNLHCTFAANKQSPKHSGVSFEKKIKLDSIQIGELEQKGMALSKRNQKLEKENKHLYAQIQYYREQFNHLITNNSADTANQIKKRLKETTEMVLNIRHLENQQIELENTIKTLVFQNQKLKTQEVCSRKNHGQFEAKYWEIHQKLKEVLSAKQSQTVEKFNQTKNIKEREQKNHIIKTQNQHQIEKLKKEIQRHLFDIEKLTKENNKLKVNAEHEKQLLQIQLNNKNLKEKVMSQNLQKLQIRYKQTSKQLKIWKDKYEEVEEDLTYAKRLIQKSNSLNEEFTSFKQEIQEKCVEEKKTVLKDSSNEGKVEKQNNNFDLKRQNEQLRRKLAETEIGSHEKYQEIIMNLGASEAFRKLLEEKNFIIKKLMREKGQIYSKLCCGKC